MGSAFRKAELAAGRLEGRSPPHRPPGCGTTFAPPPFPSAPSRRDTATSYVRASHKPASPPAGCGQGRAGSFRSSPARSPTKQPAYWWGRGGNLEAMIWETLGWTLEHPIWSAFILVIVVGTVVFFPFPSAAMAASRNRLQQANHPGRSRSKGRRHSADRCARHQPSSGPRPPSGQGLRGVAPLRLPAATGDAQRGRR